MRVVYTSSLYCRLVLEDNRESGIRRSKQREREIEGGREREREREREDETISENSFFSS